MSDIAAAAILMTWQLNWESISSYMEEHDDEISNLEGIPFWRGVCDTDAHWCQSRGSFWEIAIAGHAEDDVLGLPGLHPSCLRETVYSPLSPRFLPPIAGGKGSFYPISLEFRRPRPNFEVKYYYYPLLSRAEAPVAWRIFDSTQCRPFHPPGGPHPYGLGGPNAASARGGDVPLPLSAAARSIA